MPQAGARSRRRPIEAPLSRSGNRSGGKPFSRGALYTLLANPIYVGEIRHKTIRHAGRHRPIFDRALWEAVQHQLRSQGTARRGRAGNPGPHCLKGRIVDESGELLTTSHTLNHGRRYHYYISRKPVNGAARQGDGWRLAAPRIEQLVAAAAARMLEDQAAILDVLEPLHPDVSHGSAVIEAALAFCRRLRAEDQRDSAVAALVERVEVRADSVRLTLSMRALLPHDLTSNPAAETLMLAQTIPLQIARRGIGTKLVLAGSDDAAPPDVNAALLRLAARSRRWFETLVTGEAPSIAAVAAREGLGERYLSSLLPLAFLAPAVLEAAVAGRLPAGFPLSAMTNRPDIPIAWPDQLRSFGLR